METRLDHLYDAPPQHSFRESVSVLFDGPKRNEKKKDARPTSYTPASTNGDPATGKLHRGSEKCVCARNSALGSNCVVVRSTNANPVELNHGATSKTALL